MRPNLAAICLKLPPEFRFRWRRSVYTLYEAKVDLSGSLVVAISQSGESTDTNLVLERAKEACAVTIGITNESESSLARLADHTFLVRAGKEKSVAATKTYTGQLACLYLLAWRRRADWTGRSSANSGLGRRSVAA